MTKNKASLGAGAVGLLALLVSVFGGGVAQSAPVAPEKGVTRPSPDLVVTGSAEWASYWPGGFSGVYRELLHNLHQPKGPINFRYAQPSPIYKAAYLWDTAFISQIWKPWDPATAMEVNEAVWAAAAPDGRLQHLVSPYSQSENTQPPVMAWSEWENYLWSGDLDHLARAYPVLVKYNEWLYRERRTSTGLFFWQHPYESGIDNSPRFGSADESEVVDMRSIAAVDMNSFALKQNQVLADMARTLGQAEDEARFRSQADELQGLINELLWDPDTGYYYDRDLAGDRLVKVRTIASLFPLFAGAPGPEQAARLRDHIMDPAEFNTPFPFPSVARDDPSFEKDCWRGPVWVNTAYAVIAGLERYGYRREAAEMSFKVADGIYHNFEATGEFFEFYDPDHVGIQDLHRKRGNLYKQLTLGDKPRPNFVGWTGLANTLVIEHLIGYHRTPERRWLAPRFPASAAGAVLELTMPGDGPSVKLTVRSDGGGQGQITMSGRVLDFDLAFGEELELAGGN